MAARQPAHRPPTSSTTDSRTSRPDTAHSSRHTRRANHAVRSPPPSSSDEDMDAPLDLPTPQTMERPELGPDWSDDEDPPPRRRHGDIPIDPSLLDEEDEPYNPPDVPRQASRRTRFDPVDDALRSQGHPRRAHVARHPRPELAPESPPPGATHDLNPEHNRTPRGAGHSGRRKGKGKGRATNVHGSGSGSGSGDGSSGDGSQDSAMTVEEGPHAPPPAPMWNFNPNLYPAYDRNGGRIGLEHTRHESRPAPGGGSYYLPRTHNYHTPQDDEPRVMELDFRIDPSAIAPIPGSYVPAPRARGRGAARGATRGVESARGQVGGSQPVPVLVSREQSPSDDDDDTPSPHGQRRALEPEDYNPNIPDPEPALRELLGLAPEEKVSLNTLTEPPNGEKPGYPYPTLIKLAIYGSPNKRLTLQEIYQALIDRFQWFKDNAEDKAWQGSIRHNLSLNKCFRKVPRPISEPGKGSFWVVDYSQGEGNKRQRKRNKKKTKAQREAEALAAAVAEDERRRLEFMAQRESDRQRGHISDESPPGTPHPLHAPVPIHMRPHPAPVAGPPYPDRQHPHSAPQGGLPQALWADKHNKGRLMHVLNTPDTMTVPVPHSVRATPEPYRPASRASTIAAQLHEAHIDPMARDSAPELGHVVGEGRVRQSTRSSRASASPYQPPMDIRRPAQNRHRDSREPSDSPSPHIPHPQINPMWGVPTFGQPSLGMHGAFSGPSRPNWTPYGSPGSSELHRPVPGIPNIPSSNLLGLSAPPPGPSSSAAGPSRAASSRHSAEGSRRRGSASNARESRHSSSRALGSRAPPPPREGQRRSTRLSAKRGEDEYVDSRGNVYPVRGHDYTSDSEESED